VTSTAPAHRKPLRALISGMRVHQWVKNGLLVVAPVAAGSFFHHGVFVHTLLAIASFSLVASALYLLNDLKDVEGDRLHPTKKFRAIAYGDLSPKMALFSALVLAACGFSLPSLIPHSGAFYIVLGIYVLETLAYVYLLKSVAVIELALVAAGFFLRAYAGAVASHIFVSTWFLVVISFGALFLVVGKRSSELKKVGAGSTRIVLSEYTPGFLSSALTMSATVVVTGYCLWAFDTSHTGLSSKLHHQVPIRLSVVLVVLAMLFIMKSADAGDGAAPEDLILHDRTVQVLLVLWATLLAIGIYA
jgi:decaprenyl-phosphate phosphoribosyltransferase